MKEKEYCECCGQPIMKHTHRFSKSLAGILYLAAMKYDIDKPFHLQKDLMLTKNQYNNFQKLRYWKLVDKYYENGIRKGGYWTLTQDVMNVFLGQTIPRNIVTFNNKVVEVSDEFIELKDAIGTYDIPEIWAERSRPVFETQLNLFGE